MRKPAYPYVHEFTDRHGKPRLYFRRPPMRKIPLPGPKGSREFLEAYAAAMEGTAVPPQAGTARTKPGSISALVVAYYGSPDFLGLSASTQTTYRGIIERFRAEHGHRSVVGMKREHVRKIIGDMSNRPAAANNLLRMLRMLMEMAVDMGWRDDNPTHRVKAYRSRSQGIPTWTEDDITRFEEAYPIGTPQRTAMALLLYTGQRRSDVVRMGWQHVRDDTIRVRQQKTGTVLQIPIHPDLLEILKQTTTDNMTFVVTEYGKPRTGAGFGNWFSEAARRAGLQPGRSAHGLRKAAARRLAEAGCTEQEIKSVTGHKSSKELQVYLEGVDQPRVAKTAVANLGRPNPKHTLANPEEKLANSAPKSLKRKDN